MLYREEVIYVADEFYRKLYSSNDRQIVDASMETMNIEISCVNTNEIKKTLNRMKRNKADVDGLSIDLIKDAGDFLQKKLAVYSIKYLQNLTVPKKLKNVTIILIHKKKIKSNV